MEIVVRYSGSIEEYIGSVQIVPKDMTMETVKERMGDNSEYEVISFDDRLRPIFEHLKIVKHSSHKNLIEASEDVVTQLSEVVSAVEGFQSYIERLKKEADQRDKKQE